MDAQHDPMVEMLEGEDGASPNGASSLSVFEQLKARRDELVASRFIDVEVPGSGGLLGMRLGPLPRQKIAALTTRATRQSASPEQDFNLNADTLIAACQHMLVRSQRAEPFVALTDSDGEPIKLDHQLADLYGLSENARARQVVEAVFQWAPSPDLAVGITVGRYIDWATAANADADEEFRGE